MSLRTKIEDYKAKHPESSSLELLFGGLQFVWRLIAARIYLRKCDIGRQVSVNGKPVIDNQGEMRFSDEVRIWSTIVQAKLYTGKHGKLHVGRNSRLNGVHIDVRDQVVIGENVRIAPYTIIMDSDFHDVKNHFADGAASPIIIEDNVWIATRCTILKGVTVGKNSVIAAGAVVTKSIPQDCIAGGVPAKIIKKISD